MKHMFFEQWKNNRVKKIIDIFGEDWFLNKTIHEFGCAHGDIGLEFVKLGARVDFSDVRLQNLEAIENKCCELNYKPTLKILNQEIPYILDKQYDLLLHLGLLYNLKNWRKDLEYALESSDLMILESLVLPSEGNMEKSLEHPKTLDNYVSFSNNMVYVTEECIEEHLTKLGCKFIKFSNRSLNSCGWWNETTLIHHIYDWDYTSPKMDFEYNSGTNHVYHYRRMWLVIK